MSLVARENLNIIELEVVDSTNLYAKMNLENLPDKSIVSAIRQTSGRGRFTRSWVDLGNDNVFMSIILKPSDDFKPVYANITQYFSVVLSETFEEYGLKPSIKWPNDVLIDGKKIAGILSESIVSGNCFKGLILGFGINLNAKSEDLGMVSDKKITALNLELNISEVDKKAFVEKLLDKFFKNYDNFLKNGFSMIKQNYIERTNFLNSEISVQVFNERKSGIAKYINDFGELVLEKDNSEFVLTMGDIL